MGNLYATGVQHIGIPTNNMNSTIEFYESLGFTIAYETVLEKESCRVCFFKLGSLCIEAYENHRAIMKPGAIDHITIDTSDVEAAFEFARGKGLKLVNTEIQSIPEFWANGIRFFMIEGPNCELIEICQIL